jgi:hypothetical protein
LIKGATGGFETWSLLVRGKGIDIDSATGAEAVQDLLLGEVALDLHVEMW